MLPIDPLTPAERLCCAAARPKPGDAAVVKCDEATQELLWRSWAYAKNLQAEPGWKRSRAARRAVADGEADLATLVRSLDGLAKKLATDAARRKLGSAYTAAAGEDLIGEAMVAIMDALGTYEPGRHSTVARWTARRIRQCLSRQDPLAGGAVRTPGWRRVAAVAAGLRDDPGRTDELYDAVHAHFQQGAEASVRARHPDWDAERLAAAVRDRLSRDGITAALREFSAAVTTGQPVLRLDAPAGDGDSDDLASHSADERIGERPPDTHIAAALLAGCRRDDAALWEGRYDEDPATLATLAAERSLSVAEVRHRLGRISGRLTAPHAQWARLAVNVATQVVHVDATVPALA